MKDYEKAGVPMMPVVHGEERTRRHILVYTIELVAVTLLLPIFNLAGTVYLISALVLGGIAALCRVARFQSWREQSRLDNVSVVEYVSGIYLSGDYDRCNCLKQKLRRT